MFPDVYQPCSCGSGKKFKFCCLLKRKALEGVSDFEIIRRAAEFPVFKSLVSKNWEDHGLAQILVARQLPSLRYIVGVYLVDVLCLGLKNTFLKLHIKDEELESLSNWLPCELIEVPYEDARSIVLGGIKFAKDFGFEPQTDWKETNTIVESERDFENKFTFGKNGTPFYIEGPKDDTPKIMKMLSPLIKEGKAHFVTNFI